MTEDLTYHVEFAGRSSDTFRVTVFDYPALVRADARLEFPGYTSQKPKVVEDVRHISAVEGTKLTLELPAEQAGRRCAAGRCQRRKKSRSSETPKTTKLYRTAWTLTESRRFKLQLRDHEKRANKLPEEIVINVTPNQPPKIALERPARDVEVSPLEELQLKWKASDDFGIVRTRRRAIALGGDEPKEIELPSHRSAKSAKEQSLAHLIEFESLDAKPDQLVSYYVWAEDIGPDGKPRRTLSDMYFAEVRPFEQIYRQGEQPSEGEQQQQQQGQVAAISNKPKSSPSCKSKSSMPLGNWSAARTRAKPTAEFTKDSGLVKESQQSAITRRGQWPKRSKTPNPAAICESAQSHMKQALSQLTSAAQKPDAAPLRPALAEEQAAYQDLLKLRAREFQVVRGNRAAARPKREPRQPLAASA